MKNKLFLFIIKRLFIFLLFSITSYTYAQVGINTEEPGSTLQVNGSYGGNFKELTESKKLDDTDQLICITGDNLVSIQLPDGRDATLQGRMYNIKNSSTKDVTISGFNSNQLFRLDGINVISSFILKTGTGVQIIKNSNINEGLDLWEIVLTANVTNIFDQTKSIQYARVSSSPIDANTPENSVLKIGNIKVRYNGTSPTQSGYIEYQTLIPTQVTMWYQKAGSGGSDIAAWGKGNSVLDIWYKMVTQTGNDKNDINPANRDVSQSIIILHQTREVYRVTTNLNGNIDAITVSGQNIPAVSSSVTLFVERLD